MRAKRIARNPWIIFVRIFLVDRDKDSFGALKGPLIVIDHFPKTSIRVKEVKHKAEGFHRRKLVFTIKLRRIPF